RCVRRGPDSMARHSGVRARLRTGSRPTTRTTAGLEVLRQCLNFVAERRELRSDLGIPGLCGQVLEPFVRLPEKEQDDAPQFMVRHGRHLTHGGLVSFRTATVNSVTTVAPSMGWVAPAYGT